MSDQEFSLLDLFREEVRSQTAVLNQGLLDLEGDLNNPQKIEPLMRAAHSLKGAARIVGIDPAVTLSHVMEDALVAAQHGKIRLSAADIDTLLRGADLLSELREITDTSGSAWEQQHTQELGQLKTRFEAMALGIAPAPAKISSPVPTPPPAAEPLPKEEIPAEIGDVNISVEAILPGEEEPLFDLFREELRGQTLLLRDALDPLRTGKSTPENFDLLSRASHSIRGAARIVGVESVAQLASILEDLFSAARQNQVVVGPGDVDLMQGVSGIFAALIPLDSNEVNKWCEGNKAHIEALKDRLSRLRSTPIVVPVPPIEQVRESPTPLEQPRHLPPAQAVVEPEKARPVVQEQLPQVIVTQRTESTPARQAISGPADQPEAVVRVTAQSLNRLMSLAGESLVQARWLQPFSMALLRLKKQQDALAGMVENLSDKFPLLKPDQLTAHLDAMRNQIGQCRQVLAERMREFEDHAAQAEDLNSRLYREVIVSRMRPFSDGAHGFPRLIRDMARKLNKQVRLEIDGQTTEVDRDILEKLEAPLMHLLRNSVDHGIESPEVRKAAGKPEQGVVRIEVRHRAGMLAITISDDGAGIDLDRLSRKIVERGLNTAEMVGGMTEAELLEFLFLPGFTTAKDLTEYSGRGVGLDVLQDTIRKVGGSVRITTRAGKGTSFHLQLPITLSVLRAVLVEIAGEIYAFPHNRIDRLILISPTLVHSLEHRQFVTVDGHNVGLVIAAQLLDLPGEVSHLAELPVVLMSDESGQYGLIVEAFRGEQDLVVRPLDPRLGKVPNVSAAAILDDGAPVLIADVEDLIRSMDHFIQAGSLKRCNEEEIPEESKKRILVVDDSITVREVEKQLLRSHGYDVDVGVDGQDGWNLVRANRYDLVVSDIDMPRMTGLELVKAIREYEPTRNVPIVIISYKDREEDRRRGLELGANYYLTKSSFHDDTFLRVVTDLIGEGVGKR